MTDYQSACAYLPHRAPMVLIDKVCHVGHEHVVCEAYVSSEGVLAPFIDDKGYLPAWFALEIMAQTIAVWSGWHALNKGGELRLGMLLGARGLKSRWSKFAPNACLKIYALQLLQDDRLGSFDCTIKVNEEAIVTARLNVYQPKEEEIKQIFEF